MDSIGVALIDRRPGRFDVSGTAWALAALDEVRDAVLVLSNAEKNPVVFANKAARESFGSDAAELIGRRAVESPRGADSCFEVELPTVQGVPGLFEVRARPLQQGGAPAPATLFAIDMSDRKALLRQMLEVANREQERIGQDLHDGLGQELTGIALMLRGLASRLHRENSSSAEDAEQIAAIVNQAIASARSLARGVSPVSADRGGLVQALRGLATRSRDLYGLEVVFRSKIWPQVSLDDAAMNHLYRIAQEALTNASRHGKASRVDIRFNVCDGSFTLTVADNGKGLDAARGLSTGMGLKIIAYRAAMLAPLPKLNRSRPAARSSRSRGPNLEFGCTCCDAIVTAFSSSAHAVAAWHEIRVG
jgi:signal transduction histidine kinase